MLLLITGCDLAGETSDAKTFQQCVAWGLDTGDARVSEHDYYADSTDNAIGCLQRQGWFCYAKKCRHNNDQFYDVLTETIKQAQRRTTG